MMPSVFLETETTLSQRVSVQDRATILAFQKMMATAVDTRNPVQKFVDVLQNVQRQLESIDKV
jgi:hypothetical protein